MGSIVYDFLANSFLFNEDDIKDNYKDYSIDQLEIELESYRNHCLNNYNSVLE